VSKNSSLPIALTVAGSDSGCGAGIQADLKTFAALGVHGTCAITCITAQNPKRVFAIEPCSPVMVRKQLEAVFAELPPVAAKTGMLYSAEVIREVVKFFRSQKIPLVVDPVMVATSGRQLLQPDAVKILCRELLPRATLLTPNLPEAALLVGRRLSSVEDMRWAARELRGRFGCAVLVKGGHLSEAREAADIFLDGKTELLLVAPFVRGIRTHGTGCTYSAAITAHLARGLDLPTAVTRAKDYITRAIAHSCKAAGHSVLALV
jgi:hydroxymethylpyrimidine kinase/phosphomethylpyrimidine kinase